MLIFQSRIYRADLKANPDVFYVFGDNERRVGLGGQAAEMRGEPNAIGVATLAAPGVFWTATDTERQCGVINRDLTRVIVALNRNQIVVWPMDGIGTGLARLRDRAPATFAHLQEQVAYLKEIF